MKDAEAQPRSTHITDDEDDCVQLHERATEIWWDDLSHPDGHSREDHECAGASEESHNEEHSDVDTAGQEGTGDEA